MFAKTVENKIIQSYMCKAAMLHDSTVDVRLRLKTSRLNVQGTDN